MLTAHADAPVVAETPVQSHALHALDVLKFTHETSPESLPVTGHQRTLNTWVSRPDSHQCFQPGILTQSLVQEVGILLGGLAVLDVAVAVEHPRRDLELQGLADHCDDLVHLIGRELASALVQVNVALLAHLTEEHEIAIHH